MTTIATILEEGYRKSRVSLIWNFFWGVRNKGKRYVFPRTIKCPYRLSQVSDCVRVGFRVLVDIRCMLCTTPTLPVSRFSGTFLLVFLSCVEAWQEQRLTE